MSTYSDRLQQVPLEPSAVSHKHHCSRGVGLSLRNAVSQQRFKHQLLAKPWLPPAKQLECGPRTALFPRGLSPICSWLLTSMQRLPSGTCEDLYAKPLLMSCCCVSAVTEGCLQVPLEALGAELEAQLGRLQTKVQCTPAALRCCGSHTA